MSHKRNVAEILKTHKTVNEMKGMQAYKLREYFKTIDSTLPYGDLIADVLNMFYGPTHEHLDSKSVNTLIQNTIKRIKPSRSKV